MPEYCLNFSRGGSAISMLRDVNHRIKGHQLREAGLRPHLQRDWPRSSSKGWTRAVQYWLVLLACLAQLWMPPQHRHAPGIATQTIGLHASATNSTLARENQTFAVRRPAAVLALMMAVRQRRAKMTIVLAAPSCLPRLAFCRRKRRGRPIHRASPQRSRHPRFSVH